MKGNPEDPGYWIYWKIPFTIDREEINYNFIPFLPDWLDIHIQPGNWYGSSDTTKSSARNRMAPGIHIPGAYMFLQVRVTLGR
jgi:hypothetical protein